VAIDAPAATAVLIVRVWFEDPTPAGFRARVTTSADVVAGTERVRTTSDPAEVRRMVDEWLSETCTSAVTPY
jgi:hypothetical protein